ncbi:hypothetical protein [Planococcus plakortidis]|uniref:hypothetical protein n=1 Tax=Planococcus plakortidis TaxID=1038856 RepID=UPI00385C0F4F
MKKPATYLQTDMSQMNKLSSPSLIHSLGPPGVNHFRSVSSFRGEENFFIPLIVMYEIASCIIAYIFWKKDNAIMCANSPQAFRFNQYSTRRCVPGSDSPASRQPDIEADPIKQSTTMKSLSQPAPRVSRRSKTGALPVLVPKANPKQGSDY